MPYKRKVRIPTKDRYKKKTKVGFAMADMYASSPYLSKKKKDEAIDKLFK